MSKHNLGRKQTIKLNKCLIKDERFDFVITPLEQTIGYIRSKRQTRKKTIISIKKKFKKQRFSRTRNPALESDTTTIKNFRS